MKFLSILLIFLSFNIASTQTIPSPTEFLGYELGSQFTRHHMVVDYFKKVSETIPNQVVLEKYGTTYEGRPLYVAFVSSANNIGQIETKRQNHLNNANLGNSNPTGDDLPVVWLSYNVHGNEASSTEAAMLTIYKLLTEKADWLDEVIVIIDPCINPDGRDRYVNWYNENKNTPYLKDRNSSEHHEPWPGGRPNHYLFDLNRDWAWATQIETQSRLEIYNKWMPHIHVDFHEQGINDPYYFAPAAEPFHEDITDWQREFQTEIGKNNAKYFDENGWLYFTKERFDLLYPSYGDTYPTFMGAIGMTYEQAGHGMAGLGINTDEGIELTLKDRLLHHTTTGLSTVEMAVKNSEKLTSEFNQFFRKSSPNPVNYVVHGNADKIKALKHLLDLHDIKYQSTAKVKITGTNIDGKNSTLDLNDGDLVVTTGQPKGTMVKILFENKTKLKDSLTYDITAWNLPQTYGLDVLTSSKSIPTSSGSNSFKQNTIGTKVPGYAIKWNSFYDAKFLATLLKEGIRVRFSNKPIATDGNTLDRGTLLVLRADNTTADFDSKLIELANKSERELIAIPTGFANQGPDFGSSEIELINPPKIAVLTGEYTSSLSFGEIWHFFEQQLHYPIITINTDYFKQLDLNDYNVLVIPNGYYGSYFDENLLAKLRSWISGGGKVVAMDGALKIFAGKEGFELKENKDEAESKQDSISAKDIIPYDQRERESIKNLITGAIFNTTIDNTHPLGYGYSKNYYTLKLGDEGYSLLKNGFSVGYLGENPRNISGFAGSNTLKNLKNSLFLGEERIGQGSVIYFVDNVLFRSFWENGKLFFANALFLVNNGSYKDL